MAEPAGSGYRSPLNLGLDQLPKTVDGDLFQEMVPIYNAIHTLNAYLDRLRLSLEGGDPDKPPDEEMRIVRGFWADAAQDITQGKIITITKEGVKKGCGLRRKSSAALTISNCMLTGIAMNDALEGEKVRFGIGPAIINVPGFNPLDIAFTTRPGGDFAGDFLNKEAIGVVDGLIQVGICVVKDYVLVTPDFLSLEGV